MTIKERVQEVFNRFNVELTVSEEAPETQLAEAALENGTVIYTDAESFAEGQEAYIINDEGERIPLPPGEYELADGGQLVIGEGGVIDAIQAKKEDEEEMGDKDKEEMSAQEEVKEEADTASGKVRANPESEAKAEDVELGEDEDEPKYVTKEQVDEMIAAALEAFGYGDKDKEDMSEEPEAEAKEEEAVAMSEQAKSMEVELAEMKAELEAMKEEAAAPGLKHAAPTGSTRQEPINMKNLSTQERVAALLNQFTK